MQKRPSILREILGVRKFAALRDDGALRSIAWECNMKAQSMLSYGIVVFGILEIFAAAMFSQQLGEPARGAIFMSGLLAVFVGIVRLVVLRLYGVIRRLEEERRAAADERDLARQ